MKKVMKEITILGIIVIILILMISRKDRHLKGPNPEDLSSIILVDVIDQMGVQKFTIHKQVDINNFLDIFSNAKRIDEQSISQFPSKTKFTIVLYKFKSSGNNSWRSMYEEGHCLLKQNQEVIYMQIGEVIRIQKKKKHDSGGNGKSPWSDSSGS